MVLDGLILYVVGGQAVPEGLDLQQECRGLGLAPKMVAVVAENQEFGDVHDAWRHLLVQGMARICLLVVQVADGSLQPLRPVVRLWG